ncbi:PEP-CTERM sorting domain-containing protein [Duganella sp. FT80W]|uniref:PEP-CTERM sorting domain-containing protein n=1 Tax=Duganella guangzhouensis TaxID=2666084 RepID=A0A6I2L9Z0_9BURK|nr:PEP-CTERM sorting domain-containing protein [Duganella guangzhouensis]MRW94532.1 PEP-CTERM sorting domain-containing protein [Duganella guangzhouensis]
MPSLTSARRALAGALLTVAAFIASPAQAVAVGAYYMANVSETITQLSADSWRYSFTINNLSAVVAGDPVYFGEQTKLTGYIVPYYTDAGISDITAATGWTITTASSNPFGLETAGTLIFTATTGYEIAAGASLGGFSYVAGYGPVEAPFMAGFIGFSLVGDPSIPGSPSALGDGLQPVPEPATYGMMLAGLGLLGLLAGRRTRRCS